MKYLIVFLLAATSTLSQTYSISGIIYSDAAKETMTGANVFLEQLNTGTSSDQFGNYELTGIPAGSYKLIVSYVGFETKEIEIEVSSDLVKNFYLSGTTFLLGESVVNAYRATFRKTPIAFSEIDAAQLENTLGQRDVAHSLQSTPSVYVSAQGGGTGDLRLNMRGFGQTNIAIMLNGVPVNNPENGEVYWSNWAGISDVVDNIQVQRGIGANPYSVSAVGGLVNIKTYGVGKKEFTSKLTTEFGSNNFSKFTLSFTAPISDNISMIGLVSQKKWDGYAVQTPLNEFTYFFSIGGVFGNHSIELQGIGSPQNHGQRMTLQSINTFQSRGTTFNSDWGYLHGNPLSLRDNEFHKPTFNINHHWQINDRFVLSSVLYYTHGYGGGTTPPWATYGRTDAGLVDWDSEWEKNSDNVDSTYHPTLNYTQDALRFTVHTHDWFGLISHAKWEISNFEISAGIDAQYYSASNFATIGNLLGGDYTIWSNDVNRPWDELLFTGDTVDYNADSFVRQLGGFAQAEAEFENLTVYLNASLTTTGYNRIDYFNYTPDDPKHETGWEDLLGYTIKGGFNYNFDQRNNIYINAGYLAKSPLAQNVYDYNNNKYEDLQNEKIMNLELGYGLKTDNIIAGLNIYYTVWKDKAISKSVQDENTGRLYFYNIAGAAARHTGIEAEARWAITRNFHLTGLYTVSDNIWTENVNTTVAPESDPTQQETVNSYVKDVYVGEYPMIRGSFGLEYSVDFSNNTKLWINPVYNYFGNHYAQYDPDGRTNPEDEGVNSWKLPNYYLFDLHVQYMFMINNAIVKSFKIGMHVFNFLDNKDYLLDANDGEDHSDHSALVWYGRERWWHLSFTFNF
jgi:outer membrane receptor protein involved in Fe transport